MGIKERREREKDIRRQQIEKSAKELFILKGFNSTTMEEIARTAELSPATIYLYFKNKEDLYASINLVALQDLFTQVEKVANDNRFSFEEKMIKFKDGIYRVFKRDPLMFRNILHVQLEDTLSVLSKDLLDQLNELSQKILALMAQVYEDGVRNGVFRKGHGMAHADIIWSILTGLFIWEESKRKLNPRKNFLKPTLDKAFDIFCRGIKA